MAILNHGSTIRTADGGQTTTTIVTASNIGSYAVASNATYYIGTTQNVFNRASGAQTLTGVSIDGNAANITAYTINQNVGTSNTPSFAGIVSSAITNYAYLQVTDVNNFWITPGNNNWGLYFETSAGGLLGGSGDSNRLGFVGAGAARFYVDLNNGNGWFGASLTANTDSRSPIFYDSNNTAYYIDAASTSVINALSVSTLNNINAANGTWHTSSEGKARFYFASNGTTYFRTGNDYVFRNNSDIGVVVIDSVGNLRTSTSGDNSPSYSLHVGGTGFASADFRAPIFYDSGNTAYYLDPANTGTSLLVAGNVGINTTTANNKLTIQEVGTDGTPPLRLITTSAPATFSWFMSAMNSSLTAGKNYIGLIGQAESQNNSAYIGFNYQGAGSTSNFLTFGFYQNDNLLNLRASGNVGIGTTSPGYTLTVNGTIAYTPSVGNPVFIGNDGTYGTSGTGRYVTLGFGGLANSANKIFAHNMGEDGLYICSATSRSIYFRAGGGATDHVAITSGGNLGIATVSADTNLQVVGHVHIGNQTTFENTGGWNKTIYLDGAYHARVRVIGSAYASGKNSQTETYLWVDNTVSPYSGLATNAGSFQISAGFTTMLNSARSPLFYDSDNTAYYIDAASTSVLNAAQITTTYTNNIAKLTNGSPIVINSGFNASLALRVYYDMNLYNTLTFTDASWNSQGAIYGSSSVVNIVAATATTTFTKYAGYSQETGSFRAPIFYDSDDTTYYLDPVSTTLSLRTRSSVVITNANAPENLAMLNIGYSGSGETRAIDIKGGWSAYESKSITFNHATGSANIVAQINAQHNGPGSRLRWGKLYHSGDSSTYTMELISESTTSAYLTVAGSVRSPIFYDSGDTNYYLDPAGTSRLNTTRIGNINVGSGTYLNTITPTGDTNINLSAPSGAFYFDTFPRMPGLYDSDNTAYYVDPASTSNLNSLTVAGGNATIYRDLTINGGTSGNFGNRIIVQGTATTYTLQDTNLRPTVYLTGAYPVLTLNHTITNNANHGPTIQFAFNGLTTGGSTSRQIVVGPNGTGTCLDFGFSGGGYGSNSDYNPHNGIAGYSGVTPMRLFSNGLLLGSTGAYPNNITSTSYALDVRGTGYASSDFRSPVFYDSDDTNFYANPAGESKFNYLRLTNNNALYFTTTGVAELNNEGNSTNVAFRMIKSGSSNADGNNYGVLNLQRTNHTNGATNAGASIFFELKDSGGTIREYAGLSGCKTEAGAAGGRLMFHRYARTEIGYWDADQLFANASMRSPIFYDSNDTTYYIDAASTSQLNQVASYYLRNLAGVSTDHQFGLYFNNSIDNAYAIYREGGAWTNPYPDLRIAFHTGIKLGANAGYNGIRFYNDYTMATQVMSVNNSSDGLGADNVYVNNSLQAGSSLRAPIFYDSDNTAYYANPAGTSIFNELVFGSNITIRKNNDRNLEVQGGGGSDSGIIGKGSSGQFAFQVYGSGSGSYGFLDGVWAGWDIRKVVDGDLFLNDNNSYYLNPASTSLFNATRHNSVVAGSTSAMTSAGQLAIYSASSPYISFHDGGVGRTAYMQENGGRFYFGEVTYTESEGSFRSPIFYDSNNTAYYIDAASTSNLNSLTIVGDANLELYKSQTVDMSNTTTYSTSNYYPVTISVPTEGCIIQIQNNLNSNVPSWSTHAAGFTLNLKWRTNGSGWGTTVVRRIIDQYQEAFNNLTICGGITQMTNSSTEVVWLRGGGQYFFKFSRNLSATAQSATYTVNSQSVSPTSTAQNTIWNSSSGSEIKYNDQTISTTNMYTPVLYDWNNTSYWVDPASTSNFIGLTVANTITGSISGNAGTATTLATARTLTIGSTGKTFNGSADVSWSTTEIVGYTPAYGNAAYQTKSLDTISTPGLYQYDGGFGGTKPPDNSPNYRTIEIGSAARFSQIAMPWNSDGYYFRRYDGTSFSTWRTVLHDGNYNSYAPTLTGTGASGSWGISVTGSSASCTGNAATVTNGVYTTGDQSIGGAKTFTRINFGATGSTPYSSAAGEGFGNGITFGGDENSGYYRIFTTMENVGGNYSKLALNWHTGIRIGAYPNYGGVRFYNNAFGNGTEIFSVGSLDSNVRVVNTIYAQSFYDINNTAYYVDPNSTSNIVGLTVANTISGSINGSATSLNSSNSIARVGSSGNYNTDFQNTPAGTVRHLGDDSTITNNPGGAWWFLDNYRHSNGSNYWGTQVAWGWEDNANRLATRNVTGGSFGSWVYYLNSSNYNSYAIARGGDTVDGIIYFRSNKGSTSTVGANNSYQLQAYSSDAGAAGMSFHRAGYYAVNMGLDPDNVLRIGGWSASANRLQLDMSGNLTVAGAMYGTNFIDSDNTAYFCNPASTSNLVGLTVANTITGAVSGNAGSVTINYNNDSNSTYQMLWGSGNNVYGTAGVYLNPSTDVLYANAFYDAGNTAYYLDPNSTSNLLLVKTRNTFGERIAVTAASSTTIDTQYNVTELTMSTNVSLTLSNIQSSGTVHMWTIVTVGNGTAYSIGWPAAIKWPGGTAPTITSTNTKRDIYQFVTYDGGTNIYAIIVGQNL